jgi:hypothetical protein
MDTVNQKLPRMASALIPRELVNWSLTAVALGALEGGLLGVIVKNQFGGVATPTVVNVAVAVVAAAPSFSNLASFLFASLAVGRDKLALLSKLMLMMGACLVVMALPGRTALAGRVRTPNSHSKLFSNIRVTPDISVEELLF